jgi:predicted DNA repair protein MutK
MLLDDIAAVLDDVSVMTKVAAKKTAGVLGDDLALNAEQTSGVRAERELPVVWAVAKGSMRNKFILVPSALLISAFLPWLITPLLMLGGAYLCYEGVEKLAHKFLHGKEDAQEHEEKLKAMADPNVDLVAFEKNKIKGAVRTDFILSAEIIVIALGTVQAAPFIQQVMVVSVIAIGMTIGVYGLVAGIVKLDDAGLHLIETARESGGKAREAVGRMLVGFSPKLMKFLSIAGTAAMFLVGGGILLHGFPGSHDALHHLDEVIAPLPMAGLLGVIAPMLVNFVVGIIAGAILLLLVTGVGSLRKR